LRSKISKNRVKGYDKQDDKRPQISECHAGLGHGFLLAKNLAHRALGQVGQTCVSRGRCVLARMARQQPRRPQLVRIPVLLGLVACQRHQPGLGLQRNRRLLARSGPVIECRKRAVGHRPFDAAMVRDLVFDGKAQRSSWAAPAQGLPLHVTIVLIALSAGTPCAVTRNTGPPGQFTL
jgi:hypothetical protein